MKHYSTLDGLRAAFAIVACSPLAWKPLTCPHIPLLVWAIAASTLFKRSPIMARILNLKALQSLGQKSYSTYLWHLPMFVVAQTFLFATWRPNSQVELLAASALVTVLLTFIISHVSHTLIERPAIRLGKDLANEFNVAPN